MARITVEDCLDKVTTRYELIILAAKRARQLATGGRRPTLEWEDDKPTVMALREIEAGTVSTENINVILIDNIFSKHFTFNIKLMIIELIKVYTFSS